MQDYPVPLNEEKRLNALYEYEILDTISEKEYDSITKIAAQICNVPASLITLLDKDRQWFKSNLGVPIKETPRVISFCNYTILEPDKVLIIPDLRKDDRFQNNPLVTGAPNAVFYAGAPLVTPKGFVLGSICVLDAKVNNLNEEQQEALKGLAQQVITRLELQKKMKEIKRTQTQLKAANKNLKNFAKMVSHDMKTPLANILLVSRSFKNNFKIVEEEALQHLDLIDKSAQELLIFIDEILKKSKKVEKSFLNKTPLTDSLSVIKKVIDLIAPPADIEIKLEGPFPKLPISKTCLQQVFQNLITNAIKYNDKEKGEIFISNKTEKKFHYFYITDNGCGIAPGHLAKIFKDGHTLNQTDRYGNKGTGFGLAAVKNILHNYGGKIKVSSVLNAGTVFKIGIPIYNRVS